MRGRSYPEPDNDDWRSPVAEGARAGSEGGRCLALVRVANYALLRRHHGRARADAMAAHLAARIAAALAGGRVAAIGRDLLEIGFDAGSPDAAARALTPVAKRYARPVTLAGERCEVELFFGAATVEAASSDDVRLAERAEQALAEANTERRVVVSDGRAPDDGVDRIALAHELGRAIARDELFLEYQPKVHLRRQRVTSVEALIRWRHPERGLVPPGDFIPIAEETRSIGALTLWTIRRALVDQATLAAGGHDLRVFVNISGVLLADPAFVAQARALVGARGDRIGFEVTETAVIRDPESAITNLHAFANLGVDIAIDDYGAGLSSLAYLKRLPARELKIDKLFVTQLTSSHRDPLIVRSTIDLAHALDMAVVAEGVETQASLALLSVMGCDMAQGFLISRPQELGDLTAWLDEGGQAGLLEESRATFTQLAAAWKRGR